MKLQTLSPVKYKHIGLILNPHISTIKKWLPTKQ